MLSDLLDHLAQSEEALALARDGGEAFCPTALRPFLVAGLLAQEPARPAVVVAPDDRSAHELAGDLAAWLAPRAVRFYPSRGVTYESHLTPPPHLVGLRIAALDAVLAPPAGAPAPVLVASAPALAEKVPDPELRPHSFVLSAGDLLDLDECAAQLVEMGYERVGQVDERGQFAVRGGLLDVFGATADRATRVELFDIEVESLRSFSTFTQRSLDAIERVEIAPAAELALEHRQFDGDSRDIAELLPLDRFVSLLELIGEDAQLIIAGLEELAPTLRDHWADVCAAFHDGDAHHLYVPPDELERALGERAHVSLSSLAGGSTLELHAQATLPAARTLNEAEAMLERQLRSGYRTVVTWPRRGDGERAAHNLARLSAQWIEQGPPADQLTFAVATLQEGFIAPGLRLAVIPEHRLYQRRRQAPRPQTGRRGALRSFADLRAGDYVVHEDHGVARFAGFETRTIAGITRDYLLLEYQGDDRVYAPTDQFAKISRYVGAGAGEPTLSKLGGTRWDTLKARARHAAQELAGELLGLYVERRRREGHAFAPDGEWQREFEARFPYTETRDQREAIELVKADMEAPRPMDRLICGDVGYGKTEVALRAAFKAVADGKQVMMLVPTTILAQQHYGTFRERLADYPISVEQVSRFRSAAEQRDAITRFSEGKVDVLIGTHRLLSRDVRAKDLGLLILDEEQRFGVRQKELLRQLRLRVDVIAMSATPIPRTLQMSLAGLRDISVIETPPEGRRPVRTYVGEHDDGLVRQALEREQARGGQAFYLHNRVETIDEVAAGLRGLCPALRFEVAHGQLDEHELERRMMSFLRGDADVLVCTSIIESGIDIPQANTLVVERADHFGLAQLYQIRGRVGRSRERAYAYLLYDAAAALSPEAAQRLAALSDFTELGAGFQIAMRDLELRGAGNLLGDEQSGHVAALGFELYMQMLDEALRAAEGEGSAGEEWEPVRLDVDVDAYVPADYVGFEQAKIEVHRRIASARDVAELEQLRAELADRFGPPPPPVENLLDLQRARIKLGAAGARAVAFRSGRLAITPIELDSAGVRELRARLDGVVYESGRSQVLIRVPDAPDQRFPAVLAAADAVLAASTAST
ncbi:MAG: transcription-repair coupling factor [Solirubrobacteraceae bacterium]|jgi:transcription-repair coupling factor (superfamily II helicase)